MFIFSSPVIGLIVVESAFMLLSSSTVFIYITCGGVVGPDIRWVWTTARLMSYRSV